MEVTYVRGGYLSVNHTPSADVAAGDVIVIGDKPYVAHQDIAADALGAVAAGGGTYNGPAAGNYAPGDAVYWNASTSKFVNAAATGAHTHFGYITPDSDPASDGDIIEVEHAPNGGVSAT